MVTLTNEQSILKKNVEKELNKYIYTLDGLVTKDENSLKSIARVLDIKNIDSLNKKELIVRVMKNGYSCPPNSCYNKEQTKSSPKKEEHKQTDNKQTDNKQTDDKQTDNKQTDDKQTDDKQTGDKQTDDKNKEIESLNVKIEELEKKKDIISGFTNITENFVISKEQMFLLVIIILLFMYKDKIN